MRQTLRYWRCRLVVPLDVSAFDACDVPIVVSIERFTLSASEFTVEVSVDCSVVGRVPDTVPRGIMEIESGDHCASAPLGCDYSPVYNDVVGAP